MPCKRCADTLELATQFVAELGMFRNDLLPAEEAQVICERFAKIVFQLREEHRRDEELRNCPASND